MTIRCPAHAAVDRVVDIELASPAAKSHRLAAAFRTGRHEQLAHTLVSGPRGDSHRPEAAAQGRKEVVGANASGGVTIDAREKGRVTVGGVRRRGEIDDDPVRHGRLGTDFEWFDGDAVDGLGCARRRRRCLAGGEHFDREDLVAQAAAGGFDTRQARTHWPSGQS